MFVAANGSIPPSRSLGGGNVEARGIEELGHNVQVGGVEGRHHLGPGAAVGQCGGPPGVCGKTRGGDPTPPPASKLIRARDIFGFAGGQRAGQQAENFGESLMVPFKKKIRKSSNYDFLRLFCDAEIQKKCAICLQEESRIFFNTSRRARKSRKILAANFGTGQGGGEEGPASWTGTG